MVYVNYGCGFSPGDGWLNFDSSPTLRLERIPLLGKLYTKYERQFPANVMYDNIVKGTLCRPNEADGVFASHVLEHLSYSDFSLALKDTREMLKPTGIFCLIVPDLEFGARRYVDEISRNDPEASRKFLESCSLGCRDRPTSLLGKFSQLLGGSAHLWMWDAPSMIDALNAAGFKAVVRCDFGDCEDQMFTRMEEQGRFVSAEGRELAFECRK